MHQRGAPGTPQHVQAHYVVTTRDQSTILYSEERRVIRLHCGSMVGHKSTIFPQVDIADFDARKEAISTELGHAAREIGFFYVTGPSTLLA